MKKEEFDTTLKKIGLSRQKFADLTSLTYGAVGNWHDEKKPIPGWVKSWLDNYIERQKHEKLKQSLRDSGVCDE